MVGKPDPMEGFPSSVSFSLSGYAHNTGPSAVTLHAYANYMDAAGPHNIAIADQLLQPGETRNLNLATALKLPIRDGSVNLSFSYAAACGSVLIETASVDATGSYVFAVEPVGVGKSWGHTSHYWQIGAGTDTMYTVWNPTEAAEDFVVTLNYEPGGVYSYPLHLEPNASAMISVLDLVMMGKPDAQGRMIPAGTKMGSFSIKNANPDIRKGQVFVVSGGIYNPTAGTCCQNYWTCDGATGASVLVAGFAVPVQSVQYENCYVVQNNGSQSNYTSSAGWSSSNSSTLAANVGGAISAVSSGTATISCVVSNVPEYIAQFCGGACPVGNTGGSTGGTAQCAYPTGETTTWIGWNTTAPYRATGEWEQTLTPSNSFAGRTITESDGSPATDSCWYPGSPIAKATGVTGGTWAVGSANQWGYDNVGWLESAVHTYQQRPALGLSLPCSFNLFQNLSITCPGGPSQIYRTNVVLEGVVSGTGASSGRDGQVKGESIQP